MRRRYMLLGLLFTAAIAVFVFPLITPDSAHNQNQALPPANRNSASPSVTEASAAQETAMKKLSLKKDMASTDQLCRLTCKQDIADMMIHASKSSRPGSAVRSSELREMVKQHRHYQALKWREDGHDYTSGGLPFESNEILRKAWSEASTSLGKGLSYESPTIQAGGKSFFVMALPGRKTGDGVAALIDNSIVQKVERHQLRNLRLVPYPDNARFRTEAVQANTLNKKTVRNGEDNGHTSHYAVDEVVVKFRKPLTSKQLLSLRKELQLTVVRHNRANTYLFRSKKYKTVQLITYFKRKWNPVYAEPHYLYMTNDTKPTAAGTNVTIVPNDTLYSRYQWNLPDIATEKGWKVTKGKQDLIVAVVDTGVQADHPDLQGRLVEGTNIVDPSSAPDDDVGHGTHVAGIIAAEVNNNEGVAGMTWFTKVMPVKALDSSGAGTTYSVAQGVIWAADHGAQVINLSLGNYAEAEFLHDAIKYAVDKGAVVVAASGNDNTDRPGYPAAYPEVVAVAATGQDELRASYSNYGSYIDVAAPGTSIASTYPGSRYAALSGTSMASPHVAALASLIRAANPQLKNSQVAELLRSTARDLGAKGKDNEYGYGLIDVQAAVQAAGAASNAAAASADRQALTGGTGSADNTIARDNEQSLNRRGGVLDRLNNLIRSLLGK